VDSSNSSWNRRQTAGSASGHQQPLHPPQAQQWAWNERYGPPMSESQQLQLFARAYDEHVRRQTIPLARVQGEPADARDVVRTERRGTWVLVVGLAVFVVLLALAIGIGLVAMHP
jgi:hypothetical protein